MLTTPEENVRGICIRSKTLLVRYRILKMLGIVAVAVFFCTAAVAQIAPMNYFELASHARLKARALTDAGKLDEALEVLNSLEAGKYEVGDAAMQAAAAKIQGVITDKARTLIRLGRYEQADAAYYQAFDANIAKSEKDLKEFRVHWPEASTSPKEAALASEAAVAAKGALSLADGIAGLRESSYLLAGASGQAKPFDPARLAKYGSLEKELEKILKRQR